jgi:hypothetical protein
MVPVIGMFRSEEDVRLSKLRLMESGLQQDKVSVYSQEKAIQKLLNCKPTCVVTHYAGWGAIAGASIYAIFAVLAGLCQCNLFNFDQSYGAGTFLGGILAGLFLGGALGVLVGAAEYEKDTHLYVQGARMGAKVIVVQADEEDVEKVRHILEQARATGVKNLAPSAP